MLISTSYVDITTLGHVGGGLLQKTNHTRALGLTIINLHSAKYNRLHTTHDKQVENVWNGLIEIAHLQISGFPPVIAVYNITCIALFFTSLKDTQPGDVYILGLEFNL